MNERRTGIDLRGNRLFAASVRDEAGRLMVDRLEAGLASLDEKRDLVEQGEVTLAVPDRLVMVKRIQLEASFPGALEDRLHFELAQSLLESEETFHFDYLPIEGENRYLGMIIRQEHLTEMIERYHLEALHTEHRLSFRARAVALGKGYLTFGAGQDGDLTALADLAGETASICFIYHRRIVDIAALPFGYEFVSDADRERFAVDLKTLVNYRLSRLFEAGVSVPLGRMLLCGDGVDSELLRVTQGYFPAGVEQPRLLDGYFSAGVEQARETLPRYLVALGLAVSSS
jgi:hypothetical protein